MLETFALCITFIFKEKLERRAEVLFPRYCLEMADILHMPAGAAEWYIPLHNYTHCFRLNTVGCRLFGLPSAHQPQTSKEQRHTHTNIAHCDVVQLRCQGQQFHGNLGFILQGWKFISHSSKVRFYFCLFIVLGFLKINIKKKDKNLVCVQQRDSAAIPRRHSIGIIACC